MTALYVKSSLAINNRFDARKDRGATAVEYGLLVGLIAVAIISAVILLGEELTGLFNGVAGKIPDVPADAPTA